MANQAITNGYLRPDSDGSIRRVRQTTYVKVGRARNESGEGEHWRVEGVAPTLNLFDFCDSG